MVESRKAEFEGCKERGGEGERFWEARRPMRARGKWGFAGRVENMEGC
jgi:hypothetical protein